VDSSVSDRPEPVTETDTPPATEGAASVCPRCGGRLSNPAGLGWCPKCGYCRSLQEEANLPAALGKPAAVKSSPLGVVEFFHLLGRVPGWFWVLAGGGAVLTSLAAAADFLLPDNCLARALCSTVPVGLGLIGLLAAQVWAILLIGAEDDALGAKDVILSARLWRLTLQRLPRTRKPVWLGGWSVTTVLCAALIVGGFSYWYQFYKPKRTADRGLRDVAALAAAAADNDGGEKSLEDAVGDFAGKQDLTDKDKEKKKKEEASKVDRRPTTQCVIIGYLTDPENKLSGLVLATTDGKRLRYAGVVKRGLGDEARQELQERLGKLVLPGPFLPGLKLEAVWVKPAVFCDVHHSGYDGRGLLQEPNFKEILD
jgi:hypothetical protein